jgi:hypothetical protein
MLNEILNKYYIEFPRIQFNEDQEFIMNNSELKELLFIISEFGKLARYQNFDIITGSNKTTLNPKETWIKFENRIIKKKNIPYDKLLDYYVSHEVYQEIAGHIIIIFERFISGLSRQFIFHDFAGIGKQITANSFFDIPNETNTNRATDYLDDLDEVQINPQTAKVVSTKNYNKKYSLYII